MTSKPKVIQGKRLLMLSVIYDRRARGQIPLTFRQLMLLFGYKSTSRVAQDIDALRELLLLRDEPAGEKSAHWEKRKIKHSHSRHASARTLSPAFRFIPADQLEGLSCSE